MPYDQISCYANFMAWLGWFLVEYLSSDFILLVLAAIKNVIKIHPFIEHSKGQWNRDVATIHLPILVSPKLHLRLALPHVSRYYPKPVKHIDHWWLRLQIISNYFPLYWRITHHPIQTYFLFLRTSPYFNFDEVWKEQCKYLSKVSFKCGSMWQCDGTY